MSRGGLVAAGTLAILAALAISPRSGAAKEFSPPAQVAQITEQSLPAESLPSPAARASPASTPSAASNVPAPGPSAAPTPARAAAANPVLMPEASPSATPAPFEIGSIMPAPPLSGYSLDPLIASVAKTMPARAASMRLTEKARKAIVRGRGARALRYLGRAVSIDPSDPYAYFYLGRAYMLKKNYSQAIVFFKRAETYFGSDAAWVGETLSFEGAALEEAGQLLKAQAAYQQALAAEPNNLMALVGYSRVSQATQPQSTAPATAPPAGANLAAPAEPPIPGAPAEPAPAPAPTAARPPGY